MADTKSLVEAQFSKTAANYRTSQVHAGGADLQLFSTILQANPNHELRILDAGCGAGHTSLTVAPFAAEVVALDLSAEMLKQVQVLSDERQLKNITTQIGDVENIPAEDASFDVVVTRYSAHHWPMMDLALKDIYRVLKPNGLFLMSDVVSPQVAAQDTFLQAIELLRDPSHVRDYTISQWEQMLATAGFEVSVVNTWSIELNFLSWVQRMAVPDNKIAILKQLFDEASEDVRAMFGIQDRYDFVIPGAMLKGVKI